MELQGGQRLPQRVVNLAGDPRAFVFANLLLPRRQTSECGARGTQLFFGAPGLGDVPRDAEQGLDGAGPISQRDGVRREPAPPALQPDDLKLECSSLTVEHAP